MVVKEYFFLFLCWVFLVEGLLLSDIDVVDVVVYVYVCMGCDFGFEQFWDVGWDGEGLVDWGYLFN